MNGVHPFEAAGLGRPPYQIVDVEERRGPMTVTDAAGVTITVGAPGQPMGTCDFCGRSIAEVWVIESADGNRSGVGCECVRKVDPHLRIEVDRRKKQIRAARDEERIARARAAIEDPAVAAVLAAEPHPSIQGKTKLDYVRFLLERAGRTGRIRAARIVENAIKTKGGTR